MLDPRGVLVQGELAAVALVVLAAVSAVSFIPAFWNPSRRDLD